MTRWSCQLDSIVEAVLAQVNNTINTFLGFTRFTLFFPRSDGPRAAFSRYWLRCTYIAF